ncbi:class B sortase [Aquibacillus koreensis]|uniref:Class B sortase n=1 Tax=Aquibacillus koreensis TaxID=279446 RepID=A0A9X4AHQ0_9BACI|nr:class B sortase [Aquibacillus koreensis]MCT2537083.1 class B sortase [Aquibacillus koreensis]MDC3419934.1 class B sortase [Aquibacillus koreensis]
MNKNRFIILFALSVFLFCMYQVTMQVYAGYQNEQVYEAIRSNYQAVDTLPNKHKQEPKGHLIKEEKPQEVMHAFNPLLEKNADTIGWVTVPNTVIDYPVVKTEDNEFYLDHNFEQENSSAGAIFMDYRNAGDGDDRHTIIYGHHMKDGSMFKQLTKYQSKEFFEENRTITLNTLYQQTKWEVFSAYVTTTDFYYIATQFRSNRDYLGFLNQLQEKSIHDTAMDLSEDDQVLTLSTCSYDFDDARFVVHARRVR